MSPGTANDPVNCGQGFTIYRRYEQRPKRPTEPVDKEDAVCTDVSDLARKSPPSRLRWLEKAAMQAARGKVKASAVYDVIVHEAFASGVDNVVGSQINSLLLSNLHLFSSRQQKHLQSSAFALSMCGSLPGRDSAAPSASVTGHRRKRGGDPGGGENDMRAPRRRGCEEDGDVTSRARTNGREPQSRRCELEDAGDEAEARGRRRRRRHEEGDNQRPELGVGEEDGGYSSARRDRRGRGEEIGARFRRDSSQSPGNDQRRVSRVARNGDDGSSHSPNRAAVLEKAADSGNSPDKRLEVSPVDGRRGMQAKANVDSGGGGAGDGTVHEFRRKQSTAAAEGAQYLGKALDQIRSLGIHSRQGWSNAELTMCNTTLANIQQKLFSDEQNKDLSDRIVTFRRKEDSALNFLHHLLHIIERHIKDEETNAVLFLCLTIVHVPDRPTRIALHERALTLKRQLEEGVIASWHDVLQ